MAHTDENRVQSISHTSVVIGNGQVLIRPDDPACEAIVTSTLTQKVLQLCTYPDGVAGHQRRLIQIAGSGQPAAEIVSRTFLRLIDLGLIRAVKESTGDSCASLGPIDTLGIISCDRPEQVQTCVESFLKNLPSNGRLTSIIVADDSKSDVTNVNDICGLTAKAPEIEVRYMDRAGRDSYAARLMDHGISPIVARFALLGAGASILNTAGANRNSLLLDTVGSCFLSADDDTLCSLYAHPYIQKGVKLVHQDLPRDTWFYGSRHELVSNRIPADGDLATIHERLLGRSVAALMLETRQDGSGPGKFCGDLVRAAEYGSRVRVTMSGVAGDSGGESPWVFLVASNNRLHLRENEAVLRTAMSSREVISVAEMATVAHSSHCQAASMALDNTDILPPFLPVGRNEDGVFGVLCQLSRETWMLGHVPVAVMHSGQDSRTYREWLPIRFSDVVYALISCMKVDTSKGVGCAMSTVGRELCYIGSRKPMDFLGTVRSALDAACAGQLQVTEQAIEANKEASSYWVSLVSEHRNRQIVELGMSDYGLPEEIGTGRGVEDRLDDTRRAVDLFGRVLLEWTSIYEAAQFLRSSKNIRISRRVG